MRRRIFVGLVLFTALSLVGCGKSLSERVVGTWQGYEDGKPRADGFELTVAADGTGKLSTSGDFTWKQYPKMAYIDISFGDGGAMSMKLTTDDAGALTIAGEDLELRRKK
ncbi:MAG: hypothetical protein ACPGU1_22360 [Myxococcota bacterium]